MKTFILVPLTVLASATAFAQGSLTPPPGPPAPSMKSLDQVEARVPLVAGAPGVAFSAAGTITISQPGSYYLVKDLTITDDTANGIVINTDRVSLDLNGFSLIKTTGSGTAIAAFSRNDISVTNGKVIGGSTAYNDVMVPNGWSNGFSTGNTVYSNSGGMHISRLTVSGVSGSGIETRAGTIENCNVRVCGTGIVGRTVIDCEATQCGTGISTVLKGRVSGCVGESFGSGEGIRADNCPVSNSKGYSKSGYGLWGEDLLNCQGQSESGTGLYAESSATGCSGSSTSGIGLIAPTASHCTARSTSGTYGMDVSGTANGCRATRTGGTALRAGIAVASTSGGGTITSSQKHLGTP